MGKPSLLKSSLSTVATAPLLMAVDGDVGGVGKSTLTTIVAMAFGLVDAPIDVFELDEQGKLARFLGGEVTCLHGARLDTGGRRIGNEGFFFEPTVLSDVPDSARIMRDEPFGPVAALVRVGSVEEAIERSNALPFGLAAFAFTRSTRRAAQFVDGLESGMVSINHFGLAAAETPFGGVKDSGYGSEGGTEGLEAYLSTKFVSQVGA